MTTSIFRLHFSFADEQTAVLPLDIGMSEIGQAELEAIGIDDDTVSRAHLRILCTETTCTIEERGSTNGTRINGADFSRDAGQRLLQVGDTVAIGDNQPVTTFVLVDQLSLNIVEQVQAYNARNGRDGALKTKGISQDALPGSGPESRVLVEYLPNIYKTSSHDFLHRFLAIFEHVHLPLQWTVSNFDLYLDPDTAPPDFVAWLLAWYGITLDESWDTPKRRALLRQAPELYARNGTVWAMTRLLEIYIGGSAGDVRIRDRGDDLDTGWFIVRIRPSKQTEAGIRRVIDAHKPTHSSYSLRFVDDP